MCERGSNTKRQLERQKMGTKGKTDLLKLDLLCLLFKGKKNPSAESKFLTGFALLLKKKDGSWGELLGNRNGDELMFS